MPLIVAGLRRHGDRAAFQLAARLCQELQQPTFQRATIRRANGPVKLEWVYDSAWRFYPVEPDPSARQNGPIKCSLPLLPMETVT